MPSFVRSALLLAGCSATLALAGCAHGNKSADTAYVARDVNTLYAAAKKRMDVRDYETAAKLFDEVERQHPYSVWARRAQIMSAFSYYLAQKYPEAISSAQRFLTIHPGNSEAPYAHYLLAMSYYQQIDDVDRDQTTAQEASDAFNELIRRYPDSRYAADARLKLDLITDHLAGKEMQVGRFYQRSGRWLAATLRFRTVVDQYQTSSHAPEALERLVECYLALGIPAEADKAAAVLGKNYPTSEWYKQAYTLIQRKTRALPVRLPARRRREGDLRRAGPPRMLRQLAIHNIVLVERLEIDFEPGLGVLTGETGAGKSILLDALGLALGSRADSGLVRSGADSAAVSAELDLPNDHPALLALAAQEIAPDAGEPLILRRTLKADGASRAFAAGAAVPAGFLRDLGSQVIEVHGQHDDRGLLNPKGHRALLDAFGRLDLSQVTRAWDAVAQLRNALADVRETAAAAERDREFLEHACGEIEALSPEAGEESRLAEDRAAMQAGVKAGESLTGLDELLGGSDGALAQLRQAARRIERGAADHPLLGEALAALDRAVIETAEAEDKIGRAADALAFDPARLEQVEARLFDIRALARKHRVEPDELAALGESMRAQLAAIQASGDRIATLERELAAAEQLYATAAASLSTLREAAAERLDAAVAAELVPLKLDAARFRTAIAEAEPGPFGADRVEFEISTNPGAPFGALTRIASGGEMSRFILALKVALAEAGSAGTMIFDEVDRGVGGAVASAIGERLARLAERSQVLVVTHSPQVAARASHHYRIEKSHGEDGTRTTVRKLTVDERREEIARMLSGASITEEARAQATRLLAAA